MKGVLSKIYILLFVRSHEQKRKYLIKKGCNIGKNTRIISNISSFGTEPYLIEIGDNCLISSDVTFLTHDGGVSVLNNLNYFNKMDMLAPIKIGNNCFIGAKSCIMPGVKVGNNCVIGFGSIVTKNVPDNSVVCGVPAKVIKSIDDYYEGIKDRIYPTLKMSKKEKMDYCNKHNIKFK